MTLPTIIITAAAHAGPPVRLIIRDMSVDTVVAVLAMVGAIIAAVIVPLVQHRDRGAKVISDMTQSQSDLQDQVDKLDRRLVDMYAEDQKIKSQVARQQTSMDEDAAYIRSIAHWLQQACEVMDIPPDWAQQHPKPRLPDTIRSRITKDQMTREVRHDRRKQPTRGRGNRDRDRGGAGGRD